MNRWIAATAIFTTSLAAFDVTAATEPKELFQLGSCFHFAQSKGDFKNNFVMAEAVGLNAMRDECYWQDCEQQAGVLAVPERFSQMLDAASTKGIAPMIICSYGNPFYDGGGYPTTDSAIDGYINYCVALAKAANGRAAFFQIWNEWDGECGMAPQFHYKSTPDGYMALLKKTYPRIKQVAPDSVIVGTSICMGDESLRKMLERGLLQNCDMASLHTYNYPNKPELWYQRMLGVQEMIRSYNNGKDFPLLITEMGYPTQRNELGLSEEQSAHYLARLYFLARTLPFIKGMWWYDFQDDGENAVLSEDRFGLTRLSLTPKVSAHVLSDIADSIKYGEYQGRILFKDHPDFWCLRFKMPDGETVVAMWSSDEKTEYDVLLQDSSEPATLQRIAGMTELPLIWGGKDMTDPARSDLGHGKVKLTIDGKVRLLTGDLDNLQAEKLVARAIPDRAGEEKPKFPTRGGILYQAQGDIPQFTIGHGSDLFSVPKGSYRGAEDLSVTVRTSYDAKNFYLTVDALDDDHVPPEFLDQLFTADCIQIAFQRVEDFGTKTRNEMDVAMTQYGAKAYHRDKHDLSSASEAKNIGVAISRVNKVTTYNLTIPWEVIGVATPFQSGDCVGFSLLVHDLDFDGNQNYVEYGGGIVMPKDPSKYRIMVAE